MDNIQWTIYNGQYTMDNIQWTTDKRHHATDNRQLVKYIFKCKNKE